MDSVGCSRGGFARGTHDPPGLAGNNGVIPPPSSAEDGSRAHIHTHVARRHARDILSSSLPTWPVSPDQSRNNAVSLVLTLSHPPQPSFLPLPFPNLLLLRLTTLFRSRFDSDDHEDTGLPYDIRHPWREDHPPTFVCVCVRPPSSICTQQATIGRRYDKRWW